MVQLVHKGQERKIGNATKRKCHNCNEPITGRQPFDTQIYQPMNCIAINTTFKHTCSDARQPGRAQQRHRIKEK